MHHPISALFLFFRNTQLQAIRPNSSMCLFHIWMKRSRTKVGRFDILGNDFVFADAFVNHPAIIKLNDQIGLPSMCGYVTLLQRKAKEKQSEDKENLKEDRAEEKRRDTITIPLPESVEQRVGGWDDFEFLWLKSDFLKGHLLPKFTKGSYLFRRDDPLEITIKMRSWLKKSAKWRDIRRLRRVGLRVRHSPVQSNTQPVDLWASQTEENSTRQQVSWGEAYSIRFTQMMICCSRTNIQFANKMVIELVDEIIKKHNGGITNVSCSFIVERRQFFRFGRFLGKLSRRKQRCFRPRKSSSMMRRAEKLTLDKNCFRTCIASQCYG